MLKSIVGIILSIFVVALLGACIWWQLTYGPNGPRSGQPLSISALGNIFSRGMFGNASSTDVNNIPNVAQVIFGSLVHTYQDSAYHFSINYPDGYTPSNVSDPSAGGSTILIQDNSTNGDGGIQIFISPYTDPDKNITPDFIAANAPDVTVKNPQEVDMSAGGGKGLAFESNNAAFGGASREVWFVYNGNLYQISTYLQYGNLLQTMMGTWKFL
jgi:hypothetical protein